MKSDVVVVVALIIIIIMNSKQELACFSFIFSLVGPWANEHFSGETNQSTIRFDSIWFDLDIWEKRLAPSKWETRAGSTYALNSIHSSSSSFSFSFLWLLTLMRANRMVEEEIGNRIEIEIDYNNNNDNDDHNRGRVSLKRRNIERESIQWKWFRQRSPRLTIIKLIKRKDTLTLLFLNGRY